MQKHPLSVHQTHDSEDVAIATDSVRQPGRVKYLKSAWIKRKDLKKPNVSELKDSNGIFRSLLTSNMFKKKKRSTPLIFSRARNHQHLPTLATAGEREHVIPCRKLPFCFCSKKKEMTVVERQTDRIWLLIQCACYIHSNCVRTYTYRPINRRLIFRPKTKKKVDGIKSFNDGRNLT